MPKISKSKETNSDFAIVTAQCTSVLFITVFTLYYSKTDLFQFNDLTKNPTGSQK